MKKILLAFAITAALVSCGDARDGDATTDTTNFNTMPPPSTAPYGDTAMDMNNDSSSTHMNVDSANATR